MPKVYLVFMGRNALDLHHTVFDTLENAWLGANKLTEEYHAAGGRNLRVLHATFQEFTTQPRPSGSDGPNRFIPDWIWGDYAGGGADTRRVMGEATIKEIVFP
jgi:hypothetical protein